MQPGGFFQDQYTRVEIFIGHTGTQIFVVVVPAADGGTQIFEFPPAAADGSQMLLSDKFVPSSSCQSSPIIRDSPVAGIEMDPDALV